MMQRGWSHAENRSGSAPGSHPISRWIPMMSRSRTALLVSTDSSLIEAVQGVTGSIRNLGLRVVPGIDEVDSHMNRDDVVLVLVHQDCVADVDAVIRLL